MIMRMRCAKIVVLGDIEKAFLQLRLHEKDRDVTRFLWFKDPHRGLAVDNIVTYRLNRVLFGVISSPFLLAATIRYHMEKENTPVALEIRDSIYSDDVLLTADTTEEAISKCEEAKKLFQTAGMNLCQSQSIDAQVNKAMADGKVEELTHFLGVPWCLEEDCLKLMTIEPDQFGDPLTKRGVLSALSSNFDPLGFLVPVLIKVKAFFQGLWKLNYEWDKKLQDADEKQWFEITKDWGKELINRPRLITVEREQVFEIHVFVDASIIACAASVYLVCIRKGKVAAVNHVCAKSRFSPTKQITIPRLELIGVIIGVRALNFVRDELRLPISQRYL
ncbi:Pao retrotransposon peptidase family protein, partial [Aphelenchoides avenae]